MVLAHLENVSCSPRQVKADEEELFDRFLVVVEIGWTQRDGGWALSSRSPGKAALEK